MAILKATNGPDLGKQYSLSQKPSVMGRHPDCDIVIDVGAVSRHHARIVKQGQNYVLEDLESRNGTFLNDQPILGRRSLSDGDRVQVCEIIFTFHHDEPGSSDGSGYGPVLVDDDDPSEASGSTIVGTLNISGDSGSLQFSATAEAKLEAMLEITQSLGRALSLDKVLPQVLESLFKIFVQADRGFIVLKDEDGQLVPRWTKLRREDSGDTLRISRTIACKVMETKDAVLSADAASDARFELSQSIADFRIRSMMCAPLIDFEGEAFGVLQVDTLDQRHRFSAGDLEVLASIASQAAISIDNAQLHENALQQRAIERDLELANVVQQGFLPKHQPQLEEYQFFDFYRPANKVGGDYYDYISLPDGRLAVVLADVVGHGVAAALLMAQLSAQVRFFLASQPQPSAVLSLLNESFNQANLDDRFVTLVVAIIDPTTHQISVANAGHMAPLLRSVNLEVRPIGEEESGVPLGVLDDFPYEQYVFTLAPGEILAMYTDGISETINSQGEYYGIPRIRQQLSAAADGVETLGKNLIADVSQFLGDSPQYDDMCFVCFGRNNRQ